MSYVHRYVSDGQLRLSDAGIDEDLTHSTDEPDALKRADLVFYGVAHSRGSYEGRVFFNNKDADAETETDHEHGYAGSFWIFGHENCYGDPGHCDPTWGASEDAVDFRRPHHLLPETATIDVTAALRAIPGVQDGVTVTVVAVRRSGYGDENRPPLRFEQVRLLTYG